MHRDEWTQGLSCALQLAASQKTAQASFAKIKNSSVK